MVGLDTNILVRYLAQDDPVQSLKATHIIEHQLTGKQPGFISLVTIVETVWVPDRVYRLSNAQLVQVLERILQADTLFIQNEQEVFTAMTALKMGDASFADALIAALGAWAGCIHTCTLDRKAGRLKDFKLV